MLMTIDIFLVQVHNRPVNLFKQVHVQYTNNRFRQAARNSIQRDIKADKHVIRMATKQVA
jgi:hypothetical protein